MSRSVTRRIHRRRHTRPTLAFCLALGLPLACPATASARQSDAREAAVGMPAPRTPPPIRPEDRGPDPAEVEALVHRARLRKTPRWKRWLRAAWRQVKRAWGVLVEALILITRLANPLLEAILTVSRLVRTLGG